MDAVKKLNLSLRLRGITFKCFKWLVELGNGSLLDGHDLNHLVVLFDFGRGFFWSNLNVEVFVGLHSTTHFRVDLGWLLFLLL